MLASVGRSAPRTDNVDTVASINILTNRPTREHVQRRRAVVCTLSEHCHWPLPLVFFCMMNPTETRKKTVSYGITRTATSTLMIRLSSAASIDPLSAEARGPQRAAECAQLAVRVLVVPSVALAFAVDGRSCACHGLRGRGGRSSDAGVARSAQLSLFFRSGEFMLQRSHDASPFRTSQCISQE